VADIRYAVFPQPRLEAMARIERAHRRQIAAAEKAMERVARRGLWRSGLRPIFKPGANKAGGAVLVPAVDVALVANSHHVTELGAGGTSLPRLSGTEHLVRRASNSFQIWGATGSAPNQFCLVLLAHRLFAEARLDHSSVR